VLEGDPIITRSELRLSGVHNLANALAAILAATALGAKRDALVTTLSTFDGLPHRHRTVHSAEGVRWVDDSKATNVGATLAALRGYPDHSLHLILGGQAKAQDFSVLEDEVRRTVCRLYLIGEDGPAIGEVLSGAVPAEDCGTLTEAVRRARHHAMSDEWVLLAPACASFDQFSGYSERGDVFTELARQEVASCL
jgi:UDP-N-acetylmuramoylalanine--D-glutamate ligase